MEFSYAYFDFYANDPLYNYKPGMLNCSNLVSTYKFFQHGKICTMDTKKILRECPHACIKPTDAVKICINPSKVVISVYPTGSATLIGSLNPYVARCAAVIFTHMINRALDDWSFKMGLFLYHNFTATAILPFTVSLKKLKEHKREIAKSDYFPLYEVALKDTKVKCATYTNTINLTGVKNDRHSERHFRHYLRYLKAYKVVDQEDEEDPAGNSEEKVTLDFSQFRLT